MSGSHEYQPRAAYPASGKTVIPDGHEIVKTYIRARSLWQSMAYTVHCSSSVTTRTGEHASTPSDHCSMLTCRQWLCTFCPRTRMAVTYSYGMYVRGKAIENKAVSTSRSVDACAHDCHPWAQTAAPVSRPQRRAKDE